MKFVYLVLLLKIFWVSAEKDELSFKENNDLFDVNLDLHGSCEKLIVYWICLNRQEYKKETSENKVIVNIQIPNGFKHDEKGDMNDNDMKIEGKDGGSKVQVFIKGLTTEPSCFGLLATRNDDVSHETSATIEVNEQDDSTKKSSLKYELPVLKACEGSAKGIFEDFWNKVKETVGK